MTIDRTDPLFQFRITITEPLSEGDSPLVMVYHNGSTKTYQQEAFEELMTMYDHMKATRTRKMANFTDLPTRTPLHANMPKPFFAPKKATLDDLA